MDDLPSSARRGGVVSAARQTDPATELDTCFHTLVQSPLRAGILRHFTARPDESFDVESLMQTFGRLRLDVENSVHELVDFGVVRAMGETPTRYAAVRPAESALAELLDRISEQTAAVIYNSIVFEQTQEDSLTDPLTGLPNTRFMFMHLTRELASADRLKSEVSLLLIDLDNFKDIDDTYDHHVGDRALRGVAVVLRTAIRPYDICVRHAGDEFIVVLSGFGGEEAERKRLELRSAVDNFPFEPKAGKALPLSIIVGATIFPHDGGSYESLLATANSRMCRDKTRRKRHAAPPDDREPRPSGPTSVSDIDLQRAALGIL